MPALRITGKDIFFIGKFHFSTVNCHCTHKSAPFLCFHINCIKVTVIFTGTALDTKLIVNMIRMFDLSGNCRCRTVLRTFTAADTEFRIDMELTKCGADFCTAFLVADMFFGSIAEAFQSTDDRKRCTLSKSTESHTLNHGCKFFQFIKVGHFALSFHRFFRGFPAGCVLVPSRDGTHLPQLSRRVEFHKKAIWQLLPYRCFRPLLPDHRNPMIASSDFTESKSLVDGRSDLRSVHPPEAASNLITPLKAAPLFKPPPIS